MYQKLQVKYAAYSTHVIDSNNTDEFKSAYNYNIMFCVFRNCIYLYVIFAEVLHSTNNNNKLGSRYAGLLFGQVLALRIHLVQVLPFVYTFQCLTDICRYNNNNTIDH